MSQFSVNGRGVGPGEPTYVIVELSANHRNELDHAIEVLEVAVEAGADAVKIQTYRPDTLTIDAETDHFIISEGTPWDGQKLYELYEEGYMPWEW